MGSQVWLLDWNKHSESYIAEDMQVPYWFWKLQPCNQDLAWYFMSTVLSRATYMDHFVCRLPGCVSVCPSVQ